jgi:hypothetical protein
MVPFSPVADAAGLQESRRALQRAPEALGAVDEPKMPFSARGAQTARYALQRRGGDILAIIDNQMPQAEILIS